MTITLLTAGRPAGQFDHLLQHTDAIWTVLLGFLLWLIVLTMVVTTRCRMDGKPVFTRLRNGRVRFTWGIPQLLGYAQHRAEQLHCTGRGHIITVSELQAREQAPRHQRPDTDEAVGTARVGNPPQSSSHPDPS